MPSFDRIALNVGVAKKTLLFWLEIAMRQSDDHYVHMRFTARFTEPIKSPMRKSYFKPVAMGIGARPRAI